MRIWPRYRPQSFISRRRKPCNCARPSTQFSCEMAQIFCASKANGGLRPTHSDAQMSRVEWIYSCCASHTDQSPEECYPQLSQFLRCSIILRQLLRPASLLWGLRFALACRLPQLASNSCLRSSQPLAPFVPADREFLWRESSNSVAADPRAAITRSSFHTDPSVGPAEIA
jgi:hypothetical protein